MFLAESWVAQLCLDHAGLAVRVREPAAFVLAEALAGLDGVDGLQDVPLQRVRRPGVVLDEEVALDPFFEYLAGRWGRR